MAKSLTKFTSPESGSEAVGVDLPGELETASWCDHVVLASNEMSVVILGKSGSGKSTLARNVLGLPNKPADRVTKNCDIQVTSKHGKATKIVETTKVQDLNGRAGLLIYCIPVDPASRFDDGNPAMMKSLQDTYGKDIWKHCIIVFTFSNLAWDRITKKIKDKKTAISEYKQHINNYAAKVKEMLQTLNATEVNVKTIFQNPSEITKSTILAIPAGDEPDDPVLQDFDFVSTNITITDSSQPGKQVRVSAQDWRDALFVDVVKKHKRSQNHYFRAIDTGLSLTRSSISIVGQWAVIGAMIGTILALASGAFQVRSGATVGAIAGGILAIIIRRSPGTRKVKK